MLWLYIRESEVSTSSLLKCDLFLQRQLRHLHPKGGPQLQLRFLENRLELSPVCAQYYCTQSTTPLIMTRCRGGPPFALMSALLIGCLAYSHASANRTSFFTICSRVASPWVSSSPSAKSPASEAGEGRRRCRCVAAAGVFSCEASEASSSAVGCGCWVS